jgi:hypothetical protein
MEVKAQPLASAGFLNHQEHQEHQEFSFLRVFGVLRGSFFYGIANPDLAIDRYWAIRTIHLKSV